MKLHSDELETPVGRLRIVSSDRGISRVLWVDNTTISSNERETEKTPVTKCQYLITAKRELGEYFFGKLKQFTVSLDLTGTVFQKAVWEAIAGIPHGRTCSYGEIAAM